jgi:hypothetical protein
VTKSRDSLEGGHAFSFIDRDLPFHDRLIMKKFISKIGFIILLLFGVIPFSIFFVTRYLYPEKSKKN